jgi:hypothetical protein
MLHNLFWGLYVHIKNKFIHNRKSNHRSEDNMKRFINPAVLMQVGFNLLTVLIVVSLLYFTGALASPASTPAVPGVLPYQGMLVNSQGNPVDNLVNITFSIYPEPEGGTALWAEAHAGGTGNIIMTGQYSVAYLLFSQ